MAPCGREAHQLALCAGLPRMEYEWLHDGQSGTLRGRLLFWRISGWFIACGRFFRESSVAALCDRDCFGGFPLEYPFSVVAVDVGGTKIACAVVRYENADAAPIILSKRSIPTDAQQGGEVVLARILDLVDDVRAEALSHGETIVGVGVATAGRVDVNTGNIAFANEIMPGWSGQPLGGALRERFECPSAVLGDVQSHALGEARWGAARGRLWLAPPSRTPRALLLGSLRQWSSVFRIA